MILKLLNKREENKDTFSLIFEKSKGFSFYPGQYLDVKLPISDRNGDTKSGDTRAFTISSSPTEPFLMITPKQGLSNFKKALEKLNIGNTISTSHPVGTFTLDESSPAIFIAGGIGITPFRSIIKYAYDQNLTTPITLIYSNSDQNFLFKNELDQWRKLYPKLKIIYHNTSINGHLTSLPDINYHSPIYYLAGPPKMVDDFEKILLEIGIDEVNIRYDRFDGY